MKKILRRRPSAAMVVAVIALVAGLGGTAVAAKKLGLSALSNGAKNKTVGVGKLTYVNLTTQAVQAEQTVSASCPSGTQVIGGGIKLSNPNVGGTASFILDSHPAPGGWTGKVLFDNPTQSATVTAICAVSRSVSGAPPG
jgi:hypothetical protein